MSSAFQKKIDRLKNGSAAKPDGRWWAQNAGRRPGFEARPDPATQKRIKPRDPWGQ